MRSTGLVGAARWVGVLASTLLVVSIFASSVYASAGFGIERYGLTATEESGPADTQAGSHPYELTAEAVLEPNVHNTGADEVRNLDFELPPGLIINPANIPQDNAVGTAQFGVAGKIVSTTVYSLAPVPGGLARFDFTLEGAEVIADISIRTGSDYGMTLSIQDLPQQEIESVKLTLGGPSIPRFLTLPTSCAGSLQTTLQGESWGAETASLPASFPRMTGCGGLSFDPSINVAPDTTRADEPAGYELDIQLPQDEQSAGLATAQLQSATIALPAGTSLSMSGLEGLAGCGEAQFGLTSSQPGTCPAASAVGTVEIETPLLTDQLAGHVYMAAPSANPFGSLVALYVEAQGSGLLVKLAGQIGL